MNRGEIWWWEHPAAGRRPHLILTRQAAIPVLTHVLAAPATTTVRGIPTEVPIDEQDGMPRPCVLALDNLTTIQKSLCVERIATLDAVKMDAVCRALAVATGC